MEILCSKSKITLTPLLLLYCWERFIASGCLADVFIFYPDSMAPAVSKADLRARYLFWRVSGLWNRASAFGQREQYPGKRLNYFMKLPEDIPGS
jgi:hypothetical protein